MFKMDGAFEQGSVLNDMISDLRSSSASRASIEEEKEKARADNSGSSPACKQLDNSWSYNPCNRIFNICARSISFSVNWHWKSITG